MEPVRLGVIGCGVICGSHLKLAAEYADAQVVAVADMMVERAKATAEKFSIPSYYGSDDELLNDARIQAVVLALPTGVRTPIVFKALNHGKHVLIEKPIAMCAADVEKMIALQKDRVAGCCSCRNVFSGHAEAATRCVESGALGKIRMVRFRAMGAAPAKPSDAPPPWRQSMKANGGGILVNWSCYDLNYVMHIAGWQAKPKSVLAKWQPDEAALAACEELGRTVARAVKEG